MAGLVLAAGLASGVAPALAAPLTLPLPEPLPPVKLLTFLVGLHLIGLCFGLGGATMLDFWILRWMRWGGMPPEIERTFHFISKVVAVGIGLLWLSGLGFLALYTVEAPEKLANPKLWAKITVVAVLTVNGALIHALVLPNVLKDVRRPMLQGVSRIETGIFLASGAISGVSWYTAFALGLMRELNDRVSLGLLLSLWLAAVVASCLGALILWRRLRRAGILARAAFLPPLDPPDAAPETRIPAHRMVAVRRPLGGPTRARGRVHARLTATGMAPG
ncbi:hypothetical protein [Methylobacterium oxalidis]|uniref:DUF4149 domain-containing protein n=1 Tax=Methylobacterium oxalidis TaxID=944322 RepID=A0A512IZI2_9HYPH|nr:hypothetical protein [Methylobacterium oxalidis]GEP03110.1 hypothetical protein MOX02_11480 [Methylobacterium oxalidis]GLS67369.1 hypothetical protein GCM10007888_57530 [Methylobacterium oxalidis]